MRRDLQLILHNNLSGEACTALLMERSRVGHSVEYRCENSIHIWKEIDNHKCEVESRVQVLTVPRILMTTIERQRFQCPAMFRRGLWPAFAASDSHSRDASIGNFSGLR
jgi:hypothetical protein